MEVNYFENGCCYIPTLVDDDNTMSLSTFLSVCLSGLFMRAYCKCCGEVTRLWWQMCHKANSRRCKPTDRQTRRYELRLMMHAVWLYVSSLNICMRQTSANWYASWLSQWPGGETSWRMSLRINLFRRVAYWIQDVFMWGEQNKKTRQ